MKKLLFFLLITINSLFASDWYGSVLGGVGKSNHEVSTYKPLVGKTASYKEETNLFYFVYKIGYVTDNNNNLEICLGDNETFFNHIFRWKKRKFWFDVGYGIGFYEIDTYNNFFGGKILTGIEYEFHKNWSVVGFLNYLTGINTTLNVGAVDKSYLFKMGIKYQF